MKAFVSIREILIWNHVYVSRKTPVSPGAFPKFILIAWETSADNFFSGFNFILILGEVNLPYLNILLKRILASHMKILYDNIVNILLINLCFY